MCDTLYDGRPFRTLNVIDEGNREALHIECGTSIPSSRVVQVLKQLVENHGRLEASPFLRAAVDYETPSDCKLIGSNISAPVVTATCAGVHGLGITGDHHQTSGLCVACAADSACPGDSQVSPRQRLTRMLA